MFIRGGGGRGSGMQALTQRHLPPAHINHPLARAPMHYYVLGLFNLDIHNVWWGVISHADQDLGGL